MKYYVAFFDTHEEAKRALAKVKNRDFLTREELFATVTKRQCLVFENEREAAFEVMEAYCMGEYGVVIPVKLEGEKK